MDGYRKHLGVVLQDDFLFEGTIRENILFPRPNATEEELNNAVHGAHVHEFTDRFELGLETVIGERPDFEGIGSLIYLTVGVTMGTLVLSLLIKLKSSSSFVLVLILEIPFWVLTHKFSPSICIALVNNESVLKGISMNSSVLGSNV